MGLDQYATTRDAKGKDEELAYWRKHNRLQGWMQALWSIRTGEAEEEFNCAKLRLHRSDLEALKKTITSQTLPKTQGMFFGGDSYASQHGSDNERQTRQISFDLEFVKNAKRALEEGKRVYYHCWW